MDCVVDEFNAITVLPAVMPIKGCMNCYVFTFRGNKVYCIGDRHISFYDESCLRYDHNLQPVNEGTAVLTSYVIMKALRKGITLYIESAYGTKGTTEYLVAKEADYIDLPDLWKSLSEIPRLKCLLHDKEHDVRRLDARRKEVIVNHPIFNLPVSIDSSCIFTRDEFLIDFYYQLYPYTEQFYYYGLSFKEYSSKALEFAGVNKERVQTILSRMHLVNGKSLVYGRLSQLPEEDRIKVRQYTKKRYLEITNTHPGLRNQMVMVDGVVFDVMLITDLLLHPVPESIVFAGAFHTEGLYSFFKEYYPNNFVAIEEQRTVLSRQYLCSNELVKLIH